MSLKRISAALLLAGSLLVFGACANNEEPENTDTFNEAITEEDLYFEEGLSTERYDGYNFRILIRKGMIGDQYQETDSENVIDSAVFKRNKAVEAKYGITISATESSSGDRKSVV